MHARQARSPGASPSRRPAEPVSLAACTSTLESTSSRGAYQDYKNRDLVRGIVESLDVPVHVAGGIRAPQAVESILGMGAATVVMGTAAIENQVMVWDLCREHPGRIVVSLDVNPDEEIAIRGWRHNSGRYLEEVLIEMSSAGAAGFMIAEVGRDALEEPPNFDALRRALSIIDEPVVAAGGVRDLTDLAALRDLEEDGKRLRGVVFGREITAGRFTVEEASQLISDGGSSEGRPWTQDELLEAAARYRSDVGDEAGDSAHEFIAWLGASGLNR
jgi:phosphoribosylformimino-5-aminoimidazole carboxamide ribonucleotide (ProFAR) isomerase